MVRLLGLLALPLVCFAAPDADPAKMLRIAWASQYEWKEDGVENVTLEFTWERSVDGPGADGATGRGLGTAVFADGEVQRIHMPLSVQAERDRVRDHLDWVFARFRREPFEKRFEGVEKYGGPEDGANGTKRVTAGRDAFFLKDDRIVAREQEVGPPKNPLLIRIDYVPEAMRAGYGLLQESSSYTRESIIVAWKRTLELGPGEEASTPRVYTYEFSSGRNKESLRIEFTKATFNTENAVVLQDAARDALRAGWEMRYTLPARIRISGSVERDVDRTLAKSRWTSDVEAEFDMIGIGNVTVTLDEKKSRQRWIGMLQSTLVNDMKDAFELLTPSEFDTEFKGCGFEMSTNADPDGLLVQVYGYDGAQAFLLDERSGAIIGRYADFGRRPGWWLYKVKERDGRYTIERMERDVEGLSVDLKFRYSKKRGVYVPTRFESVGLPNGSWTESVGVATYDLSRLKVEVPE